MYLYFGHSTCIMIPCIMSYGEAGGLAGEAPSKQVWGAPVPDALLQNEFLPFWGPLAWRHHWTNRFGTAFEGPSVQDGFKKLSTRVKVHLSRTDETSLWYVLKSYCDKIRLLKYIYIYVYIYIYIYIYLTKARLVLFQDQFESFLYEAFKILQGASKHPEDVTHMYFGRVYVNENPICVVSGSGLESFVTSKRPSWGVKSRLGASCNLLEATCSHLGAVLAPPWSGS